MHTYSGKKRMPRYSRAGIPGGGTLPDVAAGGRGPNSGVLQKQQVLLPAESAFHLLPPPPNQPPNSASSVFFLFEIESCCIAQTGFEFPTGCLTSTGIAGWHFSPL